MDFINIAITPPECQSPGREAATIARLLEEEGVDFVHLRHPDLGLREMRRILLSLPEACRARVTIHSCYQLAEEGLCGGVHLMARRRKIPKSIENSRLRVSRSCHSILEIKKFDVLEDYNYFTLSPIFDSISKPGYMAAFNEDELRDVLSATDTPVIALGGVTPDKTTYLKELGFNGAALLGHYLPLFS